MNAAVEVTRKLDLINRSLSPKKKFSVLLIEDDSDYSDILMLRLGQEKDLHVQVTSDPYEAAELLADKCYDLVITDWALSSLQAPNAIRKTDEILKMDPLLPAKWSSHRVPVLIISGDDHSRDVSRIYDFEYFQFVSFLPKQSGIEKIARKVSKILKPKMNPSLS